MWLLKFKSQKVWVLRMIKVIYLRTSFLIITSQTCVIFSTTGNKFHQPWDLLLTKGGNYCLFFEPMGVILCFLKMKTFLTKHFKTSIIIHVQMVLQSSIIHVQMVLHGIGFWFTRISNFVNSCKIHWNRELAALYHEFKISQLYLYIYIYIYTT